MEGYDQWYYQWEEISLAGNSGQQTLAYYYVIPAGEELIAFWGEMYEDWCWYSDIWELIMHQFDAHEAAEQAWSDTISDLAEGWLKEIGSAQRHWEKAAFYEFLLTGYWPIPPGPVPLLADGGSGDSD